MYVIGIFEILILGKYKGILVYLVGNINVI